jgi:hypothetical protein
VCGPRRALRLKSGRFVAAESRKVFRDEAVLARCETALKHSGCSIVALMTTAALRGAFCDSRVAHVRCAFLKIH